MLSSQIYKTLKLTTVIIVIISVLHTSASTIVVSAAQTKFDEYQVKSVFLFNLAHFVFWPEESLKASDSKFTITVLGNDLFSENLEQITRNEKVGNRPIVIERISAVSELKPSHILFITSDLANKMSLILERANRLGILTVSDYPGFLAKGGAVNLRIHKNRLVLGLNPSSARKNNLEFSSKLLQLAKHIEGTKE